MRKVARPFDKKMFLRLGTNSRQYAQMCILGDPDLSSLQDHGKSKNDPYWHDVVGYNYRMTNMQAAIGLAQMERVDEILEDKIRTKDLFLKYLSKHDGLIMPPCNSWSKNIHWLF